VALDSQTRTIAPGATADVRLGPFDVDAAVVVRPAGGGPNCLFVSSLRVGGVDRVIGQPTLADHVGESHVTRGLPVVVTLLNRGAADARVDVVAR